MPRPTPPARSSPAFCGRPSPTGWASRQSGSVTVTVESHGDHPHDTLTGPTAAPTTVPSGGTDLPQRVPRRIRSATRSPTRGRRSARPDGHWAVRVQRRSDGADVGGPGQQHGRAAVLRPDGQRLRRAGHLAERVGHASTSNPGDQSHAHAHRPDGRTDAVPSGGTDVPERDARRIRSVIRSPTRGRRCAPACRAPVCSRISGGPTAPTWMPRPIPRARSSPAS